MKYEEAYIHIDNLLDKTGTGYFTDDEKNKFLDLATWEYTEYLVNSLESDAEAMTKIAPLVVGNSDLSKIPLGDGFRISLPNDLYHILRARTIEGDYNINIVSYNEYESFKKDPFHKPTIESPLGYLKGTELYMYLVVFGNASDVHIDYIKNPHTTYTGGTGIGDFNVEVGGLSKRCSNEIVNIAVRKMMLSLEDPRYQLQINELSADKR